MKNEKKNLKVFGYGLAVILAVIAYKIWHDHGWVLIHALFAAAIIYLIVITKSNYKSLKPFYLRWMKVAHFIGTVITSIILTILFYCVFGIAGLILRLIRRDILDRKLDPQSDSYWIGKDQIAFEQEHYIRQF